MRARRIRSSSRACGESRRLFAAHGVLEAADRVLHFALDLVGLAFILRLLVSQDLAGPFLHLALGLLGRAFDAILVNHCTSPEYRLSMLENLRSGPGVP